MALDSILENDQKNEIVTDNLMRYFSRENTLDGKIQLKIFNELNSIKKLFEKIFSLNNRENSYKESNRIDNSKIKSNKNILSQNNEILEINNPDTSNNEKDNLITSLIEILSNLKKNEKLKENKERTLVNDIKEVMQGTIDPFRDVYSYLIGSKESTSNDNSIANLSKYTDSRKTLSQASGIEPGAETQRQRERELLAEAIAEKLADLLGSMPNTDINLPGDIDKPGGSKKGNTKKSPRISGSGARLFGLGAAAATAGFGLSVYEVMEIEKSNRQRIASGDISSQEVSSPIGRATIENITESEARGKNVRDAIKQISPAYARELIQTGNENLVKEETGADSIESLQKALSKYEEYQQLPAADRQEYNDKYGVPKGVMSFYSPRDLVPKQVDPNVSRIGAMLDKASGKSRIPLDVQSQNNSGTELQLYSDTNKELSSVNNMGVKPIVSSLVNNNLISDTKNTYIPSGASATNSNHTVTEYVKSVSKYI